MVGLALGVAGFALLLWRGPWLIDGGHLRPTNLQPADAVVITGVRTALVALGAGAVAAAGLYYTHRTLEHTRAKDREQAELTREGQITDRYIEAIKLLSSEHATQRLGGVYALERIMTDSVKDRATIIEVLASFIREIGNLSEAEDGDPAKEEVFAALTVLGRRLQNGDPFVKLPRVNLHGVDLFKAHLDHYVDFREARLSQSRMELVRLDGARLQKANLEGVEMEKTSLSAVALTGAQLRKARLTLVNIENSTLHGVDLTDAHLLAVDLSGSNLKQANLSGAVLDSVNLRGADLTDALGCTVEALLKCTLDSKTRLPSELSADDRVQAHIESCELARAQGSRHE
ncbi:pentapeptide repeat-containing protein [Streptomyces lavendulae]|uniref:pentapeptide repeat-containing protein n=1 Tax=Streptomyces lavendulae TaxID=1914 RepID=UPI003800175A